MTKLERLAIWLGVLTGPVFFVFAIIADGGIRASDLPFAIAICTAISLGFAAAVGTAIWIIRNPCARLHTSEGFRRISLFAFIAGPAWLISLHLNDGYRHVGWEDWLLRLAASFSISIGSWLAVHLAGWVASGFSTDRAK